MALSMEELAERFAEEDRLALTETVKLLLSHKFGRKYLWQLLTWGKVGAQPFSTNQLTMAFACGELNVGQQVLAHLLEVDATSYGQLQQEQVDDNTRRTSLIARAYTEPGERPDPTFGE